MYLLRLELDMRVIWVPEIGGVAMARYVNFREQASAGEVDPTAYITLIDINYVQLGFR